MKKAMITGIVIFVGFFLTTLVWFVHDKDEYKISLIIFIWTIKMNLKYFIKITPVQERQKLKIKLLIKVR